MKTITRISITEAIYEEIGLSRKDSGDVLDMILDEIRDELVSGQDVKMDNMDMLFYSKKFYITNVTTQDLH